MQIGANEVGVALTDLAKPFFYLLLFLVSLLCRGSISRFCFAITSMSALIGCSFLCHYQTGNLVGLLCRFAPMTVQRISRVITRVFEVLKLSELLMLPVVFFCFFEDE